MATMDTNFMILHRAVFAAPVGTIGLWAGGNDFGGHGAITTYMAEPEPLEFVLRFASMLAGAAAMTGWCCDVCCDRPGGVCPR